MKAAARIIFFQEAKSEVAKPTDSDKSAPLPRTRRSEFDVGQAGRLIALRNPCWPSAASFISAIFYPLEQTNHES